MTTSKAIERARAADIEENGEDTIRRAVILALLAILPRRAPAARTWPSARYRRDPVGFMRDVLGFDPWEAQRAIADLVLEAIDTHKRVAVSSGHKIGKSTLCAALALWAYCSFPGVRVVLTAKTGRQVDGIIWREIRMLLAQHGRCVECRRANPEGPRPCPHSALIEEEPGTLARTGLVADDFREIKGFTAREAEGVAGVSGPFLVYIVDEASGVPQVIFEAIEGNRAGGALVILISNPTRVVGEFFDAHHKKKDRYYLTKTVSSEDTPNARAGRTVIPGLATREWIEEKREEYGERSPFFLVRVKGQFPTAAKGQLFPFEAITTAQERWEEADDLELGGPLYVSADVAGDSGEGDESAFAVRRGQRIIDLIARSGVTVDGHVVEVLGLIGKHRERNDQIVVVIDREGEAGTKVWKAFRVYLDEHPGAFVLVGVRASERAQRQPQTYDRVRDELAGNLADWLREGGAIPQDEKLAGELACFRWVDSLNGRAKLLPKREMRVELGRSPDRADAVQLVCWEPRYVVGATAESEMRAEVEGNEPEGRLDPYEGGIDPYAT